MPKPCDACPWVPGRPLSGEITPEIEAEMRRGVMFVCHKHMGRCHGADNKRAQLARAARPRLGVRYAQ